MANNVKLKRSATPSAVPTTGQLDLGEVAINTYDGKMFIKKDNGTASIVEIGAGGGSSTPLYYKDPVRVATTANGTLSSAFQNGSVVDGVTLATGNRILLKNQSTASLNGIYVVNASGAPTRASDMDENSEAQRGVVVYVQFGNQNSGLRWQLSGANADPIVIGTTNIYFVPVQGIVVNGLTGWTAPVATGTNAISIGNATAATAANGIAIGENTTAKRANSISIGRNASSSVNGECITIGSRANAISTYTNSGVVIGPTLPYSIGAFQVLIGTGAGFNSDYSSANYSVVISAGSNSLSTNAMRLINIGSDNYSDYAGQVVLGHLQKPDTIGEFAYGAYGFSERGDVTTSFLRLWCQTTNAAASELGTSGTEVSTTPSGRIRLLNDSSYIFDCDIIARNTATDTESKVWNVKFGIRRGTSAANTALIGTPAYTVFGEDTGTTSWDVSVTADTTNGRPNISVTGEASKTIRWVANIRMTKVSG